MIVKAHIMLVVLTIVNADHILESPLITNFGHWGEFENCTDGLLVTGFQLKVEAHRRRPDNTAVNAIKMFCGNIIFKSVQDISSYRGPFGRYQKPQYCTTYAEGFQLMSQTYQGRNKDDVAAVNFKILCADGQELEGFREPSGYVYRSSGYTQAQICEPGQGICGIQTQVEYHQGLGDDTALNNVRAKCCKVPVGVVPIGTPTSQPSQDSTHIVDEAETDYETNPVEDTTDAITDATNSTDIEIDVATTELVPELATGSTTEINELAISDNTELVTIVTTESSEFSTDAVTEVVTDSVTEVSTDAVTEVVTDSVTEVSTDAVTEVVTDLTEVSTDAVTEVVTDSVTEVSTDAVTEVVTDAAEARYY